MANRRKKGKKNANLWLDESEQELVEALKSITGKNRTEVLKEAIKYFANKKGITNEGKN